MTNNYQRGAGIEGRDELCAAGEMSVAMEEIAANMREGLLALAVGTGLQVMQQLLEADVAAV